MWRPLFHQHLCHHLTVGCYTSRAHFAGLSMSVRRRCSCSASVTASRQTPPGRSRRAASTACGFMEHRSAINRSRTYCRLNLNPLSRRCPSLFDFCTVRIVRLRCCSHSTVLAICCCKTARADGAPGCIMELALIHGRKIRACSSSINAMVMLRNLFDYWLWVQDQSLKAYAGSQSIPGISNP
jgi:hypothetical protein